jgi:hypothetical protein
MRPKKVRVDGTVGLGEKSAHSSGYAYICGAVRWVSEMPGIPPFHGSSPWPQHDCQARFEREKEAKKALLKASPTALTGPHANGTPQALVTP